MTCANFGCENLAPYPFPCCDSSCGFHYKQDLAQMQKYVDLKINWKGLKDGLFNFWPIEKCEYYYQKLKEKQNG